VVGGGTSIGCGLDRILTSNIEVDGIAIVSDAQENTAPWFYERYERFKKQFDKEPPVYLFRFESGMRGWADQDLAETCQRNGIAVTEFDMRGGFDYYSLPNVVSLMRANRYSLLEEVMGAPLLTLREVFKNATATERKPQYA